MLRPFLLIGVGGSGGKTLRIVRDNLVRRLEQAGWEGELPKAWQFLHIDVPTVADGNDPDLPGQLPERDYQGMVGLGLDYRTIDAAMVQSGGSHIVDALGGWRPDPNRVNIPASKGAGQFRALGRVITVAGVERVRDALMKARRELTGAEVIGELQAVSTLLGSSSGSISHEPTVVVVSSIAGGTGSGAVIDVCDAVRALGDKWANEIVGILYAPDVFDYLPEEARRGVRPNSLAAIAELLSGYWNEEGPSEGTTQLFAKYGVQLGSARRLGPRYPFLVGASNESVTYKTQNDIYLAMGRSLASWMSSATLQDRMAAYTQAQWAATAQSVPDKLPLHTQGTETPFIAMGSARVGLGRDRFQEYASEHLARTAVERFLRQHETLRARGDERTEKQLIMETADDVFGGFLDASGLDERGEDRNQIIDALRPDSIKSDLKAVYTEVLSKIRETIPERGARASDVRRGIRNLVNDRRSSFQTAQLALRIDKGKAWVEHIQNHLPSLAARYVAHAGAPVTAELLRRLGTEIKQVREELVSEAAAQRRWAADVDQQVRGAIDDQDTAVILRTTDRLEEAVKRAVNTFLQEQEAEIRELAAEFIDDLASNVIHPLLEAIEHSIDALANARGSGRGARSSKMDTWPAGDTVPERLKPAPNEFLLEPADNYHELLADLVRRTLDAPTGTEGRALAERQIVLGTDSVESGVQQLIAKERKWAPKNHQVNVSITATPSKASFKVLASPEDLIHRCREWLHRPGTLVGNYMAEGLREYLNPETISPSEITTRLQRFEGQLIAALNAGAPLANINTSVLVQVHDRHEVSYSTSFSEIPLPDNSPAREILQKTLQARGQWSEEITKAFSDAGGAHIDIFTVLSEPYEPVVFNSLMRPIASEWGARNKAPDQRAEFWRWRRARPLPEALPFSPGVLDSLIRGWFVSSLLNQLEVTDTGAKIFVPANIGEGGDYAAFPWPTLTAVKPGPDLLPALLESVSVAMLEVNSTESLAPMRPYERMLVLGSGSPEEVPGELAAWILDGTDASGLDSGADWEVRRDEAAKKLDDLMTNFKTYFARIAQRTELLDFPGSYELRNEILASLGALRRSVDSVQPVSAGSVFF
ncbi:tubulin-like doman-containing protein [Diaminobutyricimonas sp. LJ205]|uniref:tubulin-like doman-containing protein n=1 Tax=Diaminobutyricimonas sp. LJ205 TaxID=2683590 RepID=UPI0012F51F57|nr:tubulin-like doman-containing protein [Diaminobutyricimonas sp. LJ205]